MRYRLQDVCSVITDGSHFSPAGRKTGYPMFSVKDMREYGFSYESCKYISEEDFIKLKANGCVPRKGDVLVAKDGSYLKEVFVCRETKNEAVLSSIALFRPNLEKISSDYLCYLLKTPKIHNYIENNCVSGSALPRIVLKSFKPIELDIPSREKQDSIVSTIKPLDDKILINKKINENLAA